MWTSCEIYHLFKFYSTQNDIFCAHFDWVFLSDHFFKNLEFFRLTKIHGYIVKLACFIQLWKKWFSFDYCKTIFIER